MISLLISETPLGDKSQVLESNHPARSELPMEDEKERPWPSALLGRAVTAQGTHILWRLPLQEDSFVCLYVCERVRACTCLLVCMASAFMN